MLGYLKLVFLTKNNWVFKQKNHIVFNTIRKKKYKLKFRKKIEIIRIYKKYLRIFEINKLKFMKLGLKKLRRDKFYGYNKCNI